MKDVAIRHPKRGKAHISTPLTFTRGGFATNTACGQYLYDDVKEFVPLSHVDPADRCKSCWREGSA